MLDTYFRVDPNKGLLLFAIPPYLRKVLSRSDPNVVLSMGWASQLDPFVTLILAGLFFIDILACSMKWLVLEDSKILVDHSNQHGDLKSWACGKLKPALLIQ